MARNGNILVFTRNSRCENKCATMGAIKHQVTTSWRNQLPAHPRWHNRVDTNRLLVIRPIQMYAHPRLAGAPARDCTMKYTARMGVVQKLSTHQHQRGMDLRVPWALAQVQVLHHHPFPPHYRRQARTAAQGGDRLPNLIVYLHGVTWSMLPWSLGSCAK